MSDKTSIEWTDATWSPFRGTIGRWACTRVSPGCDHCYAAVLNRRFGGPDYAQPGQPLNDTLRRALRSARELILLHWRPGDPESEACMYGAHEDTEVLARIDAALAAAETGEGAQGG